MRPKSAASTRSTSLQSVPKQVKPEEIKLAKQVIGTFDRTFDITSYQDEYKEELRKVIDAKIAGREIVAPEVEAPAKVVKPDGRAAEEPGLGEPGEEEAGRA